MRYDRFDMTLHATIDELTELVEHHAGRASAPPGWDDTGVTIAGSVHPAVAQMVRVAAAPQRVTMIERFDVEAAPPVQIGWDASGRATITRIDADGLTIRATRVELLPTLVTQLLHLGRPVPDTDRQLVMTTAGAIDATIGSIASGRSSPAELVELFESFVQGWRVTGGWTGEPADRTITVLDAAAQGLWSVDRIEEREPPSPSTEVVLRPVDPVEVLALIGDIVTGRRAAPPRAL